MKIEYVRAKNFLCIGEEDFEIDFSELNNIILIQGRNLDFHDSDEEESTEDVEFHSNAAGKSTISEMVTYGLYGNTIRPKTNHTKVLHNLNKKKLEVEIIFSIHGERYRVLRRRKPDSLQLWKGDAPWQEDNEITQGTVQTQSKIEDILGMNHKAFINVVCFGQHNEYNFLACKPDDQRQIAESLLSLEVFKDYCTTTKNELKHWKQELKEHSSVYDQMRSQELSLKSRLEQMQNRSIQWEKDTIASIEKHEQQRKELEAKIEKSDVGVALLQYEKAQEELIILKDKLPSKLESEKSLENAAKQAKNHSNLVKEKLHELKLDRQSAQANLNKMSQDKLSYQSKIKELNDLPHGAQCPHCHGEIDKKHYKHVITLYNNKIDGITPQINAASAKVKQFDIEIQKHQASLSKVDSLYDAARLKLSKLSTDIHETKSKISRLASMQSPDMSSVELVLREKLSQIKASIVQQKEQLSGGGPYLEIIQSTQEDLSTVSDKKCRYKAKLDEIGGRIPYLSWWAKGFDDIRSFLIERIVPSLNARTADWMRCLINGKIKVEFDKHLDVTITSPNGAELCYSTICGSEKQRINLAISQAFAHIMMLSSGTWPSIVFLDEVSDSIDRRGVKSIYNMICELSNEKQVFVITHNSHLIQMLEGVDTITMLRENGSTTKM